jgi:hypothetical protein
LITLASNCLVFELASGEGVPYSPEMVHVELEGEVAKTFDAEFVQHATSAVFHYFKHELNQQAVSVGEFTRVLEKLLRGFALNAQSAADTDAQRRMRQTDLHLLARESGLGGELLFFPRLRAELQRHLQQPPKVLRFCGLRGCVKHLTGARRWSLRCRDLEGEIVAYLERCLHAESTPNEIVLVVE